MSTNPKIARFFITDFRELHTLVNKTAIRTKADIIKLLLVTLKNLIINNDANDEDKGEVSIIIEKSSRVYYISKFPGELPKKYFSFVFPFFLEQSPEQDWIIKCKSSNEIITSELIDVLLRLHERDWFEDNNLNSDDIDKFTCEYLDIISEYYTERNFIKGERDSLDIAHWSIIKNLLTFEPSYIRYDYDDNEGRLNERSHPLNHLDIHYTTAGTFKLGFDSSNTRITDRVTFETFKDILENGKMRDNLCYRLK